MRSPDGHKWSQWQRLAAIDQGHYQITGIGVSKLGSMFNYHPRGKGLNGRTNLYYIETPDDGSTWQTADGRVLLLPLTNVTNDALIHDYEAEGINVDQDASDDEKQ